MANPYFKLFTAPGSKAFSSVGLIARLPVSMTGIGIITMLSQVRGSYWLAGAVAATFAFSMALLAPQIARAADRFGQRRVLPYATGTSAIALLLLLICTRCQAPDWALFVFAALAGGMPSISAMVRARWSEIYRGTPQLHTAFSFESVLDEVAFIIGPPIAVGLSVSLFPEAGPLVAALLLVAGVTAFALQKSTQPPVYTRNSERQRAILAMPSMQILIPLSSPTATRWFTTGRRASRKRNSSCATSWRCCRWAQTCSWSVKTAAACAAPSQRWKATSRW